jgi:release factor glutamine methyltransferase
VANVPYVPTNEIRLLPPEARLYEPHVTLDGGPDGLATLRRVAASAPEWLAPGGHIFVEMSEHQAPLARSVLDQAGLPAHIATDDELGANVVIGTKPQAIA